MAKTAITDKDLKKFEKIILSMKAEILKGLGAIEESTINVSSKDATGDLGNYANHMADQGTDSQEREVAFHLASREGKYLKHLDSALDRIKRGEYGICRSCEKPIPKGRLEAVPHVTLCLECKDAEEKAKRLSLG